MAVAVLGFGFTFTMILIGSLTCDGGKGNSGKVTLIYTCVVSFFVHFFAVTARLRIFTFSEERKQTRTKVSFSFSALIWFLGIQLQESSWVKSSVPPNQMKASLP